MQRIRLRRKETSPVNDCSVASLSKIIQSETDSIPSKYASQQKFIPFFRERDAIGRLLTPEAIPENKTYTKSIKAIHSHAPTTITKPKNKPKLTQKTYKGSVPPIGYYKVEQKWIKKSFSQKKLGFSALNPQDSSSSLHICSETQKLGPSPVKIKSNFTSTRQAASVPSRKKGIWEEIALHNTPDQLKNALSFKRELTTIMHCQLSISRSIGKLKEDYYLD